MKFFISFLLLFLQLEAAAKFVVFTPPKCGTHLIGKALTLMLEKKQTGWLGELPPNPIQQTEQITQKKGFVVAHNWDHSTLMNLIQRGYKVIFLLRDPRDHAISILHWSYSPSWGGPKHIQTIPNRDERLTELITGRKGWYCYDFIRSRLDILEWLPKRSVYIARFENLVGPKGGGSRQRQVKELNALCQFLNAPLRGEEVADQLWGSSPTFRVGKIGEWKKEMNAFHIHLYKTVYQEELEKLKYEPDKNWG